METTFTTAEAAERLGLSRVRIVQLCNDGRFGRKLGRDWIITEDEIEAFEQLDRGPGRPPKDHD